tara:strand:+ start:501 stop:950 length:450 start_codon:yes stop_codon:yes gene_type:complete
MTSSQIIIEPIGEVSTNTTDNRISKDRKVLISDIEIYPRYQQSLEGLDLYSHIFVLFWMERETREYALMENPRGNTNLKKTGVLAARGRNHPNPIGLTVCELLEKKNTGLKVRKLDAYNQTKIIDIKPYDDYDVVSEPKIPNWLSALRI